MFACSPASTHSDFSLVAMRDAEPSEKSRMLSCFHWFYSRAEDVIDASSPGLSIELEMDPYRLVVRKNVGEYLDVYLLLNSAVPVDTCDQIARSIAEAVLAKHSSLT